MLQFLKLDLMHGAFDSTDMMPIREACHVVVQRNHPSKHNLWKHVQAQQQAKGLGPISALQIILVCYRGGRGGRVTRSARNGH
ncbi:L-arabinokinase isoform X1 [Iris pallida]|uniref:L-arabinokinase isoform X1 n=1 Tax=Iris pallida TaxID=29817 RepID=A0AAX6F109_IRIPA|nr:L-arabinokinase isoform X1 [Iris pallida]